MINVYFFQHRRNFFPLLEYFVNKIKPENKKLIKFYFLMTQDIDFSFDTNIQYKIIYKDWKESSPITNRNITDKIIYMIKTDCEYCVKMEEDIIFSNHVWDHMIENRKVVKEDNIIALSPTLNIGSYTTEFFIDTFCPEKRGKLEKLFLQTKYDNRIGIIKDQKEIQEDLNNCTINAKEWNYENFKNILLEKYHRRSQLHPATRFQDCSDIMIEVILENVDKFISKQDYSLVDYNELKPLAFSPEIYLGDHSKLQKCYYEIIENNRKFITDETIFNCFFKKYKHIIIKNSYAIHTYYSMMGERFCKWKRQQIHDIILQKTKEYYNEI